LACVEIRQARRRLSISSELSIFSPANGETFKQELWSRNGFGQARRARFYERIIKRHIHGTARARRHRQHIRRRSATGASPSFTRASLRFRIPAPT